MKKILIRISAFFMLALLAVGVSPTALTLASAESAYTSVMQDLEKGGVSEADYPIDNADYSIKVIQIAESTGGELFVYTYQPRQTAEKLVATCINMGLSEELDEDLPADPNGGSEGGGDNSGNIGGNGGGIGGNGGGGGGGGSRPASYTRTAARAGVKTKLYDLSLVSSQSVFCKYVVKDITVSTAAVRYYNITSIYRKYINGIDAPLTGATVNGQIINETAFAVGNLYIAKTDENGEVTYESRTTETIEVTDKYCGYIRYPNGFSLLNSSCDSWYVAFSTDRQMEYLLEADVQYISQDFWGDWEWRGGALWGSEDATNDVTTGYSYIKCTDEAGNNPTWLFGHKYEWKRIETAAHFCSNESLSDSAKAEIQAKKWVLRFKETDYKKLDMDLFGNHYQEWRTKVSEVTILRLKFETDNHVYNLGAVDNKQSKPPYSPPDNTNTGFDFLAWLENVTGISRGWWIAIAVLLVLAILMPILSVIFPVVGVVLKRILKGIGLILLWIFKGLWWLISLPFRLIARAVQKCKGKKDNGE